MKHAMCAITIHRNKDKEMLQSIYDDLCAALGSFEADEDVKELYDNIRTAAEELSNYLIKDD